MNKDQKTWLWVIGIIILLLVGVRLLLPLFFENQLFYFPHMMSGYFFPIGMGLMIFFWGGVIYLVYRLLIQDHPSSKQNELSILKKRLSRGEITIEEYEQIKKKLEEDQ